MSFNLKGVGIGDGLVDPEAQFVDVATFAYQQGLVSQNGKAVLQAAADKCETELHKYDKNATNSSVLVPASAGRLCDAVINTLGALTGKDIYNLDKLQEESNQIIAVLFPSTTPVKGEEQPAAQSV